MDALKLWAALGAAVIATTTGCAQGPMMGRGMGGPGMGASGTAAGHGMGMGMGMADESMPGWAMMSEQEREAHRSRMRSGMDPQECQRYMADHHQRMVDRAKERGMNPPGPLPAEACPRR